MPFNRPGFTSLAPCCSLEGRRDAASTTITLHGEFDLASEDCFRNEVGRLVDRGTERLVLDLRPLTFMDSTGLRMLLTLNAIASSDDFALEILCDIDGPVAQLLRHTGLDTILPVGYATPVPSTGSLTGSACV